MQIGKAPPDVFRRGFLRRFSLPFLNSIVVNLNASDPLKGTRNRKVMRGART